MTINRSEKPSSPLSYSINFAATIAHPGLVRVVGGAAYGAAWAIDSLLAGAAKVIQAGLATRSMQGFTPATRALVELSLGNAAPATLQERLVKAIIPWGRAIDPETAAAIDAARMIEAHEQKTRSTLALVVDKVRNIVPSLFSFALGYGITPLREHITKPIRAACSTLWTHPEWPKELLQNAYDCVQSSSVSQGAPVQYKEKPPLPAPSKDISWFKDETDEARSDILFLVCNSTQYQLSERLKIGLQEAVGALQKKKRANTAALQQLVGLYEHLQDQEKSALTPSTFCSCTEEERQQLVHIVHDHAPLSTRERAQLFQQDIAGYTDRSFAELVVKKFNRLPDKHKLKMFLDDRPDVIEELTVRQVANLPRPPAATCQWVQTALKTVATATDLLLLVPIPTKLPTTIKNSIRALQSLYYMANAVHRFLESKPPVTIPQTAISGDMPVDTALQILQEKSLALLQESETWQKAQIVRVASVAQGAALALRVLSRTFLLLPEALRMTIPPALREIAAYSAKTRVETAAPNAPLANIGIEEFMNLAEDDQEDILFQVAHDEGYSATPFQTYTKMRHSAKMKEFNGVIARYNQMPELRRNSLTPSKLRHSSREKIVHALSLVKTYRQDLLSPELEKHILQSPHPKKRALSQLASSFAQLRPQQRALVLQPTSEEVATMGYLELKGLITHIMGQESEKEETSRYVMLLRSLEANEPLDLEFLRERFQAGTSDHTIRCEEELNKIAARIKVYNEKIVRHESRFQALLRRSSPVDACAELIENLHRERAALITESRALSELLPEEKQQNYAKLETIPLPSEWLTYIDAAISQGMREASSKESLIKAKRSYVKQVLELEEQLAKDPTEAKKIELRMKIAFIKAFYYKLYDKAISPPVSPRTAGSD